MLAYVGLLLFLYFFQHRLIFYPLPRAVTPAGANVSAVEIAGANGSALRGWLRRGNGEARPIVVYYGGNAEELSYLAISTDFLPNADLLLVNYRGYGDSAGEPSAAGLLADAPLVLDYALALAQRAPQAPQVFVLGRSLGGAMAVQAAAARPVAGVILVTPFDELGAVAAGIYPWVPVRWLLRHHLAPVELAPQQRSPLLMLVAERDRLIPAERSRRLFKRWGGMKNWRSISAVGHDDIALALEYDAAINAFIAAPNGLPDSD
jgi:pimeloyl-ACP methyl ester carboxylesterase